MEREVARGTFDRPGAFASAECASLVALAHMREGAPAPVWDGSLYHADPAQRRATTFLLDRDLGTAWLFDRLDALFAAASEVFGLAVDPLFEPVQLVRYGPGDHFQAWHSDAGHDRQTQRRLSMSVELSEPADYQGGLLEIVPWRLGTAPPAQGHATIFPSRALHRVTPVTTGTRYALVAWTGLAPAPAA